MVPGRQRPARGRGVQVVGGADVNGVEPARGVQRLLACVQARMPAFSASARPFSALSGRQHSAVSASSGQAGAWVRNSATMRLVDKTARRSGMEKTSLLVWIRPGRRGTFAPIIPPAPPRGKRKTGGKPPGGPLPFCPRYGILKLKWGPCGPGVYPKNPGAFDVPDTPRHNHERRGGNYGTFGDHDGARIRIRRQIAQRVAELLGVKLYNKELITLAAKKSG